MFRSKMIKMLASSCGVNVLMFLMVLNIVMYVVGGTNNSTTFKH